MTIVLIMVRSTTSTVIILIIIIDFDIALSYSKKGSRCHRNAIQIYNTKHENILSTWGKQSTVVKTS